MNGGAGFAFAIVTLSGVLAMLFIALVVVPLVARVLGAFAL